MIQITREEFVCQKDRKSSGKFSEIVVCPVRGRINFLRRKSSYLFGQLFSDRNSFLEDGSNHSFYEEISLDLK